MKQGTVGLIKRGSSAVLTTACLWGLMYPEPALAQEDQIGSRGFSPDKVYDFSEVDSVSLWNGGLTLTIPLGVRYPINSRFSYGFTLVYNSQMWDVEEEVVVGPPPDFTEDTLTEPVASPSSNAGLGWTLTLGMLFPPKDSGASGPESDVPHWLYVGPDGGKHYFINDELHNGDNDGSATTLYTRDSSYLRMREASSTEREIDFPDGTIHTFEDKGTEGWRLVGIRDRFGGATDDVTIAYQNGFTEWEIADRHGRTHTVTLEKGATAGFALEERVTQVDLEVFGGATGAYTFAYQDDAVDLCHARNKPGNPAIDAPLLTTVTLADGSDFDMLDGATHRYHTTCSNTEHPGGLKGLTLPTMGSVEWEWGIWTFPLAGPRVPTNLPIHRGVRQRTLQDATGLSLGTWSYYQEEVESGPIGDPVKEGTRTDVVYPTGDCSRHFFHARLDAEEYGLPFSPVEPKSGEFFLSTEVWPTNTGGPSPAT